MSTISSTEGQSQYYSKLKDLANVEDDLRKDAKRLHQNHEEQLDHMEQSYNEDLRRQEERFTRAAGDIRTRADEQITRERDRAKDEVERMRSSIYDRNGKITATEQDYKDNAQKLVDEMAKDYEHLSASVTKNNEEKLQTIKERAVRNQEETARTLRNVADEQSKVYRDQVSELVASQNNYAKSKAQGRADAIKEYEDEWLMQSKHTADSYQNQIDALKKDAAAADAYYRDINSRNMMEKDKKYAEILYKQNLDQVNEKRNLEKAYESGLTQAHSLTEKERQHAEERLQHQLTAMSEEKDKLVELQAKSFQENASRQRARDSETIANLKTALKQQGATGDIRSLPPAVESTVTKIMEREIAKNIDAYQSRDEKRAESMQKSYSDRMASAIAGKNEQMARASRASALEKERDRNDLLQQLNEVEYTKDATLRSQQDQYQREMDNQRRVSQGEMDNLRRQYSELLETMQDDAIAKQQGLRQQSEFELKMAHRTFSVKQNELIREYEKRLANQKADFNAALQDVKSEADRTIRDNERNHRKMMEEQSRQYEQKIAQLESQQKERERQLVQNYEDNLERVKRSNALLIQKKS